MRIVGTAAVHATAGTPPSTDEGNDEQTLRYLVCGGHLVVHEHNDMSWPQILARFTAERNKQLSSVSAASMTSRSWTLRTVLASEKRPDEFAEEPDALLKKYNLNPAVVLIGFKNGHPCATLAGVPVVNMFAKDGGSIDGRHEVAAYASEREMELQDSDSQVTAIFSDDRSTDLTLMGCQGPHPSLSLGPRSGSQYSAC